MQLHKICWPRHMDLSFHSCCIFETNLIQYIILCLSFPLRCQPLCCDLSKRGFFNPSSNPHNRHHGPQLSFSSTTSACMLACSISFLPSPGATHCKDFLVLHPFLRLKILVAFFLITKNSGGTVLGRSIDYNSTNTTHNQQQ